VSAAPQPDAYARAARRFSGAAKLSAVRNLLNWDARTHMPTGGAWARGEEMAALTEVIAEQVGSAAAGGELDEAEAMAGALTAGEQADLREMRRLWVHAAAVPAELLAAKARLAETLQAIWVEARVNSDFAAFAGPFAEMLAVIRQIAAAKAAALGTTDYGALIDEFDPGVGEAMIEPIFVDLARVLPGLLAEVRDRQASWPAPIPFGQATVARQARLAARLLAMVGHSAEHTRLDPTAHPFSVGGMPGDARLTTHYKPDNVRFAIMATLHEAGHSMYELNLPRAWAFRPAGHARGMTVHESQSLALEMMAGRSREFIAVLAPMMARAFGGADERWSAPNVLNAWRRMDDGCIRVEADEISYPLHVILRHRLETAMIAGDLAVPDLPAAWNELSRQLLGRTPPDLARGCLQDIHWAAGHIGYFPNYAMGSMLACQLFERATADDPDILPAIGRGDFGPYFAWMRPKVHERASLADVATIVEDATGAPLGAEAFKRHVRRRYLEDPLG